MKDKVVQGTVFGAFSVFAFVYAAIRMWMTWRLRVRCAKPVAALDVYAMNSAAAQTKVSPNLSQEQRYKIERRGQTVFYILTMAASVYMVSHAVLTVSDSDYNEMQENCLILMFIVATCVPFRFGGFVNNLYTAVGVDSSQPEVEAFAKSQTVNASYENNFMAAFVVTAFGGFVIALVGFVIPGEMYRWPLQAIGAAIPIIAVLPAIRGAYLFRAAYTKDWIWQANSKNADPRPLQACRESVEWLTRVRAIQVLFNWALGAFYVALLYFDRDDVNPKPGPKEGTYGWLSLAVLTTATLNFVWAEMQFLTSCASDETCEPASSGAKRGGGQGSKKSQSQTIAVTL